MWLARMVGAVEADSSNTLSTRPSSATSASANLTGSDRSNTTRRRDSAQSRGGKLQAFTKSASEQVPEVPKRAGRAEGAIHSLRPVALIETDKLPKSGRVVRFRRRGKRIIA